MLRGFCTCWLLLVAICTSASAAGWQAALQSVNITPPQYMPMAGYASRGAKHAESKLTDLWAKVLVLKDEQGAESALVTLDLIGIDRILAEQICDQLQERLNWNRSQIALCTSHTHTGPVVYKNLRPMHYMLLDDADRKLVDDYANFVRDHIVTAVVQAREQLQPAELQWGSGKATFAVNRRNNKEADVPTLREADKLVGPSDHDVPVLTIRQKGKLTGIVFGYACHCTTLGSFEWSGDYAGFAQLELEQQHPGCVAMFWAGCGGDQNPLPRRTVELAKDYGHQLAVAVTEAVSDELHPIKPRLRTDLEILPLPFGKLPTSEELESDTQSSNKYIAVRAKSLLSRVSAGEMLETTYPYPVEVWQLGDDVRWVFLGGEVVVDYAIRIKDELGSSAHDQRNVWVAGYSNDVMAYIPSRRVLLEGGYEGGGAMVYYGLPTIWAPEVEEDILRAVHQIVGE